MPVNISVITIAAPPDRVWEALTDPALVKQWQFGSDLQTTWEPGSPIRFTTPWNGQVFEQWGTVLEVAPARSLRYSLFAPRPGLEDRPENYFTMTYELHEEGAGTRLEIRQEDNRPGAVQEPEQGEENPVLQGLKTLAESK